MAFSGQKNIENPSWVNDKISTYKNRKKGNPPYSIYSYKYNEEKVFYIPAQCCDQYSALFDAKGEYICAPGGGYMGLGDGKCNGFFKSAKNKKIIWLDSR
jgi:hypothetical protein